jgi:hypothetical protein
MAFQITAAYGVVMVTILLLAGCAVKNRLSGWHRHRLSLPDILLDRAIAKAESQQSTETFIPSTGNEVSETVSSPIIPEQLTAMAFALKAHGQISPSDSRRDLETEVPESAPSDVTLSN